MGKFLLLGLNEKKEKFAWFDNEDHNDQKLTLKKDWM